MCLLKFVFSDQLYSLGAPYKDATPTKEAAGEIVAGDNVKIELEVDVFKMMQDGHGGWNDHMAKVPKCMRPTKMA